MQTDLDSLENKLTQLLQLTQRLRTDNHQLRQELANALSNQRHCHDKIDTAAARLTQLLQHLPADTPAP
jgi:cell division protein ZapB